MLRLKKKETLIFWSSFAMLVSSSQLLALLCICKCIYICIRIWVNILYILAISLLVSSYKCNFFVSLSVLFSDFFCFIFSCIFWPFNLLVSFGQLLPTLYSAGNAGMLFSHDFVLSEQASNTILAPHLKNSNCLE